ncbi:MAG: KpsF/GutQ family sugar-phosphate isomerase [Proteobacteria bacterium]|nr:KpsF/GutQ family sugar-phosphate isomerase [Pseudomonadota bacterium]
MLETLQPVPAPSKNLKTERLRQLGKAVIKTELEAIKSLEQKIDHNFSNACQLLLECQGRIVVMGIGKSGHIARKVASTMASTGTVALFVHPGEASHGDMGMITPQDVIIIFSNSGETPEIINLLPSLKRLGVGIIALTGKPQSTLAIIANVHIDVSVEQEACPLGLAPTSSTTAALVAGDALAIALLEERGFTAQDFALSHPGGSLGKKLLLYVDSLMHTGNEIPKVKADCLLNQTLLEVTRKRFGMTTIVDQQDYLKGVFTDGDLRRALDKGCDIHKTTVGEVMTTRCVTLTPKTLAVTALQLMQANKITALVVIDAENKPIGIIHIHDLLQARVT